MTELLSADILEIVISDDGKKVWINAPLMVFRAYNVKKLVINDRRTDVICPDCQGERRHNGRLCTRCGGTAQIRRAELMPDETAPFERAK